MPTKKPVCLAGSWRIISVLPSSIYFDCLQKIAPKISFQYFFYLFTSPCSVAPLIMFRTFFNRKSSLRTYSLLFPRRQSLFGPTVPPSTISAHESHLHADCRLGLPGNRKAGAHSARADQCVRVAPASKDDPEVGSSAAVRRDAWVFVFSCSVCVWALLMFYLIRVLLRVLLKARLLWTPVTHTDTAVSEECERRASHGEEQCRIHTEGLHLLRHGAY